MHTGEKHCMKLFVEGPFKEKYMKKMHTTLDIYNLIPKYETMFFLLGVGHSGSAMGGFLCNYCLSSILSIYFIIE